MRMFKSFSAKLTNYLVHRGFKIMGTEPNMKRPQFDVYLFEDTEELRKVFNEFCSLSKENK